MLKDRIISANEPRTLPVWALLSGLALLPLLPLGIFTPIDGILFKLASFVHLFFFFSAVSLSTRAIGAACSRAPLYITLPSLLLICAALTVITCESLVPITNRDALIHHLAVPNWWSQANHIFPIPWHEWSYYPMLLDLGYLFLLSVGQEWLTPFYHASYLLILVGCLVIFMEERWNRADLSVLCAALLISLPICTKMASSPMVDLGLALYSFLAFAYIARWLLNREASALIGAGIALGLCMSCKYNGILVFVAVVLATPLFAQRTGIPIARSLAAIAVLGALAMAVYSPWWIKNIVWTNNPLYPLYGNYFPPSIKSPPGIPSMPPIEQRIRLYGENLLDIALIPLRMVLFGQDDNPQYFDGVLSPLLLLGFIPLVLNLRKNAPPWLGFISAAALLYGLLALFLGSARIRYLVPCISTLTVLSASAVLYCKEGRQRAVQALLLAIQLVFAANYWNDMLHKSDALEYLRGGVTREDYLNAHIPEFPLITYINKELPKGATIYILGTGNRYYYYQPNTFSGGHFSASYIVAWLRESATIEALLARIKEYKIEYLLANIEITNKTLNDVLDDRAKTLWNEFVKTHLQLLDGARGFALWKVV